MSESGIDIGKASFATEFGRDLEYYSGLVFQIEAGGDKTSPIAGGGRYDGLLRSVGATRRRACGRLCHPHRAPARLCQRARLMAAKLTIAVPAKGRLKDNAAALFERAGLTLRKTGHERGYSGVMQGSTASRSRSSPPPRSCISWIPAASISASPARI